jgi:hypothetical protein
MARNAADPEAVAKAEKQEAVKAQQLKVDLAMVLRTPEGKRLIAYLLEKFNPLEQSFDTNGSIMSRNEGRREAGREIYRMIQLVSVDTANEILHSFDKKEKEDA